MYEKQNFQDLRRVKNLVSSGTGRRNLDFDVNKGTLRGRGCEMERGEVRAYRLH